MDLARSGRAARFAENRGGIRSILEASGGVKIGSSISCR